MAEKSRGFREQGALTLKKPLMLDGAEVSVLRYDFDLITVERYLAAVDGAAKRSQDQMSLTDEQAFNLFREAACVCHAQLAPLDLNRLHVKDVILGARLGRGFFTQGVLEVLTRLGDE